MMHESEKSDSAIVAGKSANKTDPSVAELMEPRAETKGNARRHPDCRWLVIQIGDRPKFCVRGRLTITP